MTDFMDRAQALEQRLGDQALTVTTEGLALPGLTVCEDCGNPISAARLEALPSARRCVPCQDQAERLARGYLGKGA